MDSVVLFKLCLLFLCQTGGSTDVKTLFVQTGEDVLLGIMDADAVKDYLFLAWRVKKKDSNPSFLVSYSRGSEPDVPENYNETVFPLANFSVILKNLQKADSGLYDAQVNTRTGQVILVTYNITVQDPVSPVEVTVNPVSFGPDSCNVTASCTTDDHTISSTFTCTNQTCTDQGDKPEIIPSAASLHIYLSNDSIICNHSNQVNWTTASKTINLLCLKNSVERIGHNNNLGYVSIIVVPLIIVVGVVSQHLKKREDQRQNADNTVYAIPELPTPAQHQTMMINDTSVDSPTSTYSLVGPHTGPKEKTIPESLYAQVQKPPPS